MTRVTRFHMRIRQQRGYLLLAVSLALIVLSMFGYTALELGQGEAQLRATDAHASNARYAAQAGVAKAQWQLAQNDVCAGYPNSTLMRFDDYQVSSTITPGAGSPVSIKSKATNAAGVVVEVQRNVMPVLRAQEMIVLSPGDRLEDTYVKGDRPDQKQNGKKDIKVGIAKPQISLIKFDFLAVPLNVHVLEATLELNYKSAVQVDPGALVSIFPMRQPWDEQNATFNEDGFGNAWSWPNAYDGSDRIDALDLSVQSEGDVEFDITRLVRAWVSGERENFGLAIAAVDEIITELKFSSSDEGDATAHPKLTITYACECGVVCSLAGESLDVLMIVAVWSTPEPEDVERRSLLESMGHSVTMIDDDSPSALFSLVATSFDVAYISSTVDGDALLGDLADFPIGIVSEHAPLLQEIGFADAFSISALDGIRITDSGHYITSGLIFDNVIQLTDGATDFHLLQGAIAAGARLVGAEPIAPAAPSLAVLESGAIREDGTPSAARRVNLPWAGMDSSFSVTDLTPAGRKILQRSLDWASIGSGGFPDYHDNFPYRTCAADPDYRGSVGETDWSSQPWTEDIGDGFSCSGTIRLGTDPDVSNGANQRLIFAGDGEISREVDLTGYTTAFVGFDLRRAGSTLVSEEIRMSASIDGSFYTDLGVVSGGATDSAYLGYFADITPYISANTHIKFEGIGLSEAARFYVDTISVTRTAP